MYFLDKYDELSKLVAFGQKLRYFTEQNGQKKEAHENEFCNQKSMLETVRGEKVVEKNVVICLVSMFSSWLMVLKLSKKCIFCNFVLTLSGNSSLLKQFTYIHLKVLVMHFQKMVLLIMLWLTSLEILAIKVEEFC